MLCIIAAVQLVEIGLEEAGPPKRKKKKQKVRDTFPKVHKYKDCRTGKPYWQVDARSNKWGMNDRPTFGRETEALDRARAIARQIENFGAQTSIPKEKLVLADA